MVKIWRNLTARTVCKWTAHQYEDVHIPWTTDSVGQLCKRCKHLVMTDRRLLSFCRQQALNNWPEPRDKPDPRIFFLGPDNNE